MHRLALIVVALTGLAQVGMAQTGSIAGTVTEHLSNVPLTDITVSARDLVGYYVNVQTDTNGQYQLTGLPPGDYWLQTSDPAGLHVGQIYNGLSWISWCAGCSPWGGGGDLVSVTAGQTTPGVDFILTVGGHVSGRLTDAATASPVSNVTVCVYDGEPWYCANSDSNGSYDIGGLAIGSYSVYTNGGGYLNQVYGTNVRPLSWEPILNAPAVAVSEGSTTPNIDMTVTAGGRLGGIVTDAASRAPVASVAVQIVNERGFIVDTEYTSANGQYLSARGLPSGRYYVRAYASQAGLVSQFYGGTTAPGGYALSDTANIGGDPVVLTAPQTKTGIDFALPHGGTIAGHVTDRSATPLAATITILDGASRVVAIAYTDGLGDYAAHGIPDGSWYVQVDALGYVGKFYPNTVCASCGQFGITPPAGAPVIVRGRHTATANFSLASTASGQIAGRAFDAVTGHGMAGQLIDVLDSGGAYVSTVLTDDTGGYETIALRPGTYYLTTFNWGGWVDQAYGGQPCGVKGLACNVRATTPVSVTGGATVTGINFPLQKGATISGVVKDSRGRPAAGVVIAIYDARGRLVEGGIKGGYLHTSADGSFFSWAALPDGTYYVRTFAVDGSQNAAHAPITIAGGASVSDVNMTIRTARRGDDDERTSCDRN